MTTLEKINDYALAFVNENEEAYFNNTRNGRKEPFSPYEKLSLSSFTRLLEFPYIEYDKDIHGRKVITGKFPGFFQFVEHYRGENRGKQYYTVFTYTDTHGNTSYYKIDGYYNDNNEENYDFNNVYEVVPEITNEINYNRKL